ncbi:MAG: hypothetical protein ABW184_02435 [Sphingobium sp.]
MTPGNRHDPNAGRPTAGDQKRPMSEDEVRDASLDDSMDASDPPAIKHPGGDHAVPSSGFTEEK